MSRPTRFSLSVAEFAKKTNANVDLVVRKVAIEMLTRIVMRSPVLTGRFRANWNVSIGEERTVVAPSIVDPTGRATILSGIALLSRFKGGTAAHITNGLPYGPRLEDGWSKQAPSGFVARTVVEFQGIVRDKVQEVRR